ncbi:Rhophilin-1 [Plecturocebus cupreus]
MGSGLLLPVASLQGCDSLTQTQHDQLQSRRARIYQQIDKELQMRTGAENLYRATSNSRVRETVALELSYVNSHLQLLKEELEELSGSVDSGRRGRCRRGGAGTAREVRVGPAAWTLAGTGGADGARMASVRALREQVRTVEGELQISMREGYAPCRRALGVDAGCQGQQGSASQSGVNASGCSEAVTVPMIPLGLKETKELDWSTPLKVGWETPGKEARHRVDANTCPHQELISVHFGEDGASYEAEIRELEALRQAMRTPSRNEAGLELLTAYYHQLCLLDARFVTPTRSLGLFFQWYDSLTGVPAQQRALAFEKGSVLFNIGALHTQIGARQDRACVEGAHCAVEAFQRAAGAFSLLRENFSHAPSPDMSAPSLCALEQLMMAQAQECVFEGLSPPASMAPRDCLAQLHLAQEAAQVAAEYRLVHRTMAQPPVHDYVPVSWTTLVHVKAEYFCSLAHYHVAMALCDGSRECPPRLPVVLQRLLPGPHGCSVPQQRPRESSPHTSRSSSNPPPPLSPEAPHCRWSWRSAGSLSPPAHQPLAPWLEPPANVAVMSPAALALPAPPAVSQGPRAHTVCDGTVPGAGKAHLKRAILGQEEALRLHALCRVLREVDLLRAVVAQALQRSLSKYSELDCEDDFCEAAEAPEIRPKTHQKPEAMMPHLSQGKGPDIFHRLGPLSVFSAKNRWQLVGPIHLTRGEGGFGLTLRGDSPVLIAAVIPGGQAAAAGLKEGDYIVAVNGQPCRWWRHAEVVAELRAAGDAGASLQVVSLLPSSGLPSLGDRRPALMGPRGLLRSQREHGCRTPASTRASPRPLLGWSRKTQQGKTGGCSQPGAPGKAAPPSPSALPGRWLSTCCCPGHRPSGVSPASSQASAWCAGTTAGHPFAPCSLAMQQPGAPMAPTDL